ncbi:Cupin superfamily protein [Anatilimnocola aggregata]|uniref:Cupin superfamily protein n=1 Tax=Anatilimnocola aggregata TaxID=2528021 RepID=A0A517Y720_9BACT|nr:cupin domain-containing protein [Anatilimnocola aggregata]QDU26027.1 Cupin superfamily protein [Anatilimnocola aggregata]
MILQRLLGDVSAATFLEEHFFRTPFARPGGCLDVIAWDAATTCQQLLPQPELDLLVTREGRPWEGPPVNSAALGEEALAAGYTLCLRHADKHDPVLAKIAAEFQAEFLAPIDVHIYCTPAEQPGFSWHYDAEEVFILQTEGSKDWWLRKNTVNPWPLVETIPADMRYEREIMPALHCTLQAGDWLYIPAGYWHRTSATERSTSLSIGILSPTGIDLFDFLRTQLLDDLRWRQRLPVLGAANPKTPEEVAAQCQEMFAELAKDLQRRMQNKSLVPAFIRARGNSL